MGLFCRSCRLLLIQKYLLCLLGVSFICGMILSFSLFLDTDVTGGLISFNKRSLSKKFSHLVPSTQTSHNISNNKKQPWHIRRDDGLQYASDGKFPPPNYNAHVFYYPWYGAPDVDGTYLHWNHGYLQHWEKKEASRWPQGRHKPPVDIASTYYPELGPYSSRNPHIIDQHMRQIRTAGIGVLAVSWYPPGQADDNGRPSDDLMSTLMDAANTYQLKVCFHIEPYKERNASNIRQNLEYIKRQYGSHPAMYQYRLGNNQPRPLFYMYDSYLMSNSQWNQLLKPTGTLSIRNTDLDAVMIGLIVEESHKRALLSAGFNGFYTYFASESFTYGSTTRHWGTLATFARANRMLFIPSVGPGYDDTRVRPWNHANSKNREHGGYFEQSFKSALSTNPPIISITSFNEWHEGTQIERAVPYKKDGIAYLDYLPQNPDYYLDIARSYIFKLKRLKVKG